MTDAAPPHGPATDNEEPRSPPPPFAWADGFMDVVAKYERNSERQLYVYGISVSRCAYCRHRLKADAKQCENCGHAVSTKSQRCIRCSGLKPGLWCYECDAYFCEPCHSKPHVLVLGGRAPDKHHCYPIDGSSGKLLRHGSWSSPLLAMAKAARRSQMELREDAKAEGKQKEAKANGRDDATTKELSASMEKPRADEKSSTVEKKQAAKETAHRFGKRPVPVTPPTSLPPEAAAAANASTTASKPPRAQASGRSRSPSPVPAAANQMAPKLPKSRTPSPTKLPPGIPTAPKPPQRPNITVDPSTTGPTLVASRKRKSPTVEQPLVHAPPAPQRSPSSSQVATSQQAPPPAAQPGAERTGMTLYEQLRQMKNKNFQRQHCSAASAATASKAEPPVAPNRVQASAVELSTSQQTAPSALHATQLPTNDEVYRPSPPPSARTTPVAAPSVTVQDNTVSQQQQSQTFQGVAASGSPHTPAPLPTQPSLFMSSDPTEVNGALNTSANNQQMVEALVDLDDPLRDATLDEYDAWNLEIAKMEKKIEFLNARVRQASQQDMAAAAMINDHVALHRTKLRAGEERRERALAKVILFSPSIRAFVRNLTQHGDIPQVLGTCHSKCVTLSQNIRTDEAKLKELRAAIDEALSSSDAPDLMHISSLGTRIAALEEQIRGTKTDRDNQFQIMYQFSKRVREQVSAVQAAIASQRENGQPSV